MSPRISKAIDEGKNFFGIISGEPHVPTTCVLLRELVHAIEILEGYSTHELKFGCDPAAPQMVLDSLLDGSLVARAFGTSEARETDTIIPRTSWPILDPMNGEDAYTNGFWMHAVLYERDCRGFIGELPFVLRSAAIQWVESRGLSGKRGRPRKREETREAYIAAFPQGHGSTNLDLVHREVQVKLGQTVSKRLVQAVISDLRKEENAKKPE